MVVFDKVPPCYNSFEQGHTAFVQTIMRCIPTVERCIQDRFHVSHNMSKFFNNMCPTYNFLILVGWRHATVVRDAQDVEAVDQAGPSSQRSLGGSSESRRRAQSKANSIANLWWCTCQHRWPAGSGRQWHHHACPREIYAQAVKAGQGGVQPLVGQVVTCMGCAGPRAGQRWRFTRVHKDGWVQVVTSMLA